MKTLKLIFLIPVLALAFSACHTTNKLDNDGNTSLSDEEFLYDAYFLEALRLKTIGRPEEALANLEQAREINPENPVVHYQLAEVNTQLGNYRAAMHYAENATSLDADNVWYHILLVQLYQNAGLFAKATGEMEEIIRLEPRQLEFYFMLSNLYMAIGDTKSAISTLDKAEKEFGIVDIIIVEKESIYLEAGKNDKAIKEVEKLVDAFPDVAKYKAVLAELYMALNQPEEAKAIYDNLADENIEDGKILLAMSEFYRGQQNYEKAFDFLKKAFADENLDIDIKVEMLVSMLTTSGNSMVEMQTQKEIFDVLLLTHPEEPKALTIYSDFLVKVGDFKQARTTIRKVLETESDKYMIWEQLLYIDNHLIDFDALLTDSDTVMQLFPVQPIPYLFNSMAAYQLNNNDLAIESAKLGLDYVQNDIPIEVEFLTLMAESYYRKKEYQLSDSLFDRILEIDPENVFILNNYAYYLSQRKAQLEKASEMSTRLINLRPDNPSYLDTHGWVLFQLGEYESAKSYIKRALENGGNERPAILEHYGDVLYILGQKEEALGYWKEAARLGESTKALDKKISTGSLE